METRNPEGGGRETDLQNGNGGGIMPLKGADIMAERKRDTAFERHNNYNRENYDRVNIMVPKGRREVWKEFAAKNGLSMNALVNQSVEEKIQNENPKPD